MYHGVCVEWIDDLKVPKVGSVLKCLKLRNAAILYRFLHAFNALETRRL